MESFGRHAEAQFFWSRSETVSENRKAHYVSTASLSNHASPVFSCITLDVVSQFPTYLEVVEKNGRQSLYGVAGSVMDNISVAMNLRYGHQQYG